MPFVFSVLLVVPLLSVLSSLEIRLTYVFYQFVPDALLMFATQLENPVPANVTCTIPSGNFDTEVEDVVFSIHAEALIPWMWFRVLWVLF